MPSRIIQLVLSRQVAVKDQALALVALVSAILLNPRAPGKKFTRDETVALGALFMLSCRDFLDDDRIINEAEHLCERIVGALEYETGVAW